MSPGVALFPMAYYFTPGFLYEPLLQMACTSYTSLGPNLMISWLCCVP